MAKFLSLMITRQLGLAALIMLASICHTCIAAELAVGSKVGGFLQAALAAGKQQQWGVALLRLQDAEALTGLTAFEQFKISETYGWVYASQKKYTDSAAAYEKTLVGDFLTGDAANARLQLVTELYLQAKQITKAAEFVQKWRKLNPDSDNLSPYLAQLQYEGGQYSLALETIKEVLRHAEAQHQLPKEAWLLLSLNAAYRLQEATNAKDSQAATVLEALENLVRYYPKPSYWERLLVGLSRQQNSDVFSFELFRFMLDTNTLKNPDDFIEMAQLAKNFGLPGEALTALEKGYANGVLGVGRDRNKHERLLAVIKDLAKTDRTALSRLERKSRTSAAGEEDVLLGQAYLSYRNYPKAIEVIQRGLQKGSIKRPDQAQLALGVALMRNKQYEQARTAFQAVRVDTELSRIAALWILRASSP